MDRRTFLGLLAGSFTLNLLPSGPASLAIKRLPKFDRKSVRFSPWLPYVDQAVIVSKGLCHVTHQCSCGRVFHGMYCVARLKESELVNPCTLNLDKWEAQSRALDSMEAMWEEVRNSGLIRHGGCPLQIEA